MAGFRGIDVRQSSASGADRIVFRFSLKDGSGADVTSGATSLKLYELQSDGTFRSYDFADDTFKATALTTETLSLTHRSGNAGATATGIWTAPLATLTGFTAGNIYLAKVANASAVPAAQERQFQYGMADGDDFAQTGDNFARLGSPAGVSIAADIATRSTYAGGAVASVAGDVGGKVLGGGSGTIAGVGARAVDGSGNALATALGQTSITTDTGTLVSRINGLLQSDGSGGYQYTVLALANAPAGGGGGGSFPSAAPTDWITTAAFAAGTLVPADVLKILGGDPVPVDLDSVGLKPTGLDQVVVESGINARQALAPILAAAAGRISGAGTGTVILSNPAGTTVRVTGTVDDAGDRTAIALNLPA